ncbi:SHOCT domain-containing protein [Sulfurimonas sp. C5]|uniref:SHOCT domain-containing protein n=1 Tax=Sulfurimonas sp. C5 TaxID=3036947 RepID=UPI0024589767|nr:SHOCT domain-containing protein [Sulfurimonas sp. C5]MDH4944174.1 SHOCT domain-containing protein [Sulfurimonas sp. C5]
MEPYYGMHGWGMGFGWLIFLLIIVAVIYFMRNDKIESKPSAKDILDQRYAAGEIDTEEYLERKKHIEL